MMKIPFNGLTSENIKDLNSLFYSECTLKEISSKLNISSRAVARFYKENNMNSRNRYKLNERYFSQIDERKRHIGLAFFSVMVLLVKESIAI